MSMITWRSAFETGNAAIDHEHREMIELLNRLHDELSDAPSRERVQAFLGEVFTQISAHFALEEAMMRRENYDGYEEHKADHEVLLDDIRDIMDAEAAGAYIDLSGAFAEILEHWFVDHFSTLDARLHRVLGHTHD